MDFYEKIIKFKKDKSLNNNNLGQVVLMNGDTFRKALSRKSLSDLEMAALNTFIDNFDFDKASYNNNFNDVKNLDSVSEPNLTGYYYPDVLASAGLESEMLNEELNKIPINIPNWGKDLSFINVYGDSMYPKYCAGEIIGIKEIEASMLHFGLAYVIIMGNGEVYLKYITAGKNPEYFTLSSENPRNPPREYHLNLIKKIYIVKGVLTKTTM